MRRSLRSVRLALPVALLALGLAVSSISAHVTVNPPTVPADSSQTFTVRVPTEKPVPTTQVKVEFPAGLTVSRFQPVAGWTRTVERDGQQRIIAVTWSGGQIADGEYQDFAFIARTPRDTGKLSFKAYQTYQGGETVEWVNPEGSQERPAALVTVGQSVAAAAATTNTGSIEGRDGMAGSAVSVTASPVAVANTSSTAAAPAAAASGGSDLGLLLGLLGTALGVIAVILSGLALARKPQRA
jgi:uncharacterized protein YcnI